MLLNDAIILEVAHDRELLQQSICCRKII